MIGKKAEEVLNRAVTFAYEHQHEYCTLEHVLLSLLDEADVQDVLTECGADLETLRAELMEFLEKDASLLKTPAAEPESGETPAFEQPVATLETQRLVQRALFQVQSAGKNEVNPLDLLVAIFQAKESRALHLLSRQGVKRLQVIDVISHGILNDGMDSKDATDVEGSAKSGRAQDPLALYTIALNKLAEEGKLDPLIGRKTEIQRMIQILCRRRKNNPILVGEAGVGKTAIVDGLALKIVSGDVPSILKNVTIYSLDLGAVLAGSKYRGDFEDRIKKVLRALDQKRDQGLQPILFIDEIHTIIGAGSVSGSVMDAASLLKPLLSRGILRCIGSTTYQEYRGTFEKDHALARRFQKLDIVESTQDETLQILHGLKAQYEEHHQVRYVGESLKTIVELSSRFLTDRFLPDKAIDVMDEAGAKMRLEQKEENAPAPAIDAEMIEDLVAQIARIPTRNVSTNQKTKLKNLDRDLKLTIFGQDHVIEALSVAIRLARSGLRTAERPVGCFLFCGPTGVGKTELSRQLSLCLGVPFLRFDMSEYMEKHTVSRLIGAPPGYVGFEQAGLLTDAVLKNPHSVILLDEIEKAHPDIWNILLQVMDHGVLTDNNGRKADFRNAILIMTSNVGSREMGLRTVGLTGGLQVGEGTKKAVERAFSPEFRNRLDGINYFNSLGEETIQLIVGKLLMELESQLLAKGVEMDVSREVVSWLAKNGFDQVLGARPMARLIQEKIKKQLSEEILFGQLEHGGSVRITLHGEELRFEVRSKKESASDLVSRAEVSETSRD